MDTSKRVMIVEDDPLLSIVEEKLVTKLGYTVVGKTASGEDMLEKFSLFDPEILIMDMQLSGALDGIQAVQKLRSKHIDIPVIFLSGDDDPKIVNKAKEVNFIDFLLKPVTAFGLSEPLKKASRQLSAKAQYAA